MKQNSPQFCSRHSSEQGAIAIKAALVVFGLMLIALITVALVFGLVVSPGQIGVRLISFGPNQGFVERGLPPGYHWRIPGYSEIFLVPQTVTVFDFHRTQFRGGEGAGAASDKTQGGPLEIPTADRTTVRVDVSVLTRFFTAPSGPEVPQEQQHGGPAQLIKIVGTAPEQWENRVRRVVEDSLRKTLGELSTAQFYEPELRESRVERAFGLMEQALRPLGIKVEAVLLRRYTYEEGIENAIFQKNLQELERELAQKQGDFAKAEAEVRQTAAQGDAKVVTLQVEGDNRALVLRSEGDLYLAEKMAQGDLLVAKARAEVDELRATALATSEGAEIYVARELVGVVDSVRGGVLRDLNPLDLEGWMTLLGSQNDSAGRAP